MPTPNSRLVAGGLDWSGPAESPLPHGGCSGPEERCQTPLPSQMSSSRVLQAGRSETSLAGMRGLSLFVLAFCLLPLP